jgi:HSP20 family molecular chaperone IbpA
MQPELVAVMRDQVRTIYRAVTGDELPEPSASESDPEVPFDEVTRRFVELEVTARTVPFVAERVPPFSFVPPLDVTSSIDEIVVEFAVPGVDRSEVTVDASDEALVISGFRRESPDTSIRTYSHAEIPRGPFHRVFRLPFSIQGEPAVNLDRGMLRIHLTRARASPPAENDR